MQRRDSTMAQMYFEREPQSESRPVSIRYVYRGRSLVFETDSGVFSRGEMDAGSALLLECLPMLSGRVLDLGCGWGALGVSVACANPEADVTCVDVNLRALGLCEKNAQVNGARVRVLESDGVKAIREDRFDTVITNPPIRAGKQKVYELLKEAQEALDTEGKLYLVIRKQQGAESCIRYLKSLFRQVDKIGRSGGFWILCAGEKLKEGASQDESGTDVF